MAKSRKWIDPNLPVWFDGTNINEAVFCDEFLSSHKIVYSNRAFFTPDGRVTDVLPLQGEIFERLKCCAVNNIPRKVSNILEVMKLAAHVEDFAPEADRIRYFEAGWQLHRGQSEYCAEQTAGGIPP